MSYYPSQSSSVTISGPQYTGAGLQLNTGISSPLNVAPLTTSQLSQLSAINPTSHTFNVNSIFDALKQNYKKYEVFELQEDVLVLSVTWKRLRDEKKHQGRISKLIDNLLFSEVTPEDREKADVVRDYYSKKVMMLKLKGKQFTHFREDLNSFIHGDGKIIKEEMFPLAYRLPEFYDYDISIDDIKVKLDLLDSQLPREKYLGKTDVYKCNYLGSTFKKTRRIKSLEYWFKTETNECVKIQLEPSNPLLHMWDNVTSSKKVLQIKGNTKVVKSDDFDYLLLNDWKLMNFV